MLVIDQRGNLVGSTPFERMKQYVGFTHESSVALREFHPNARDQFAAIVDDFYAAIDAHPDAQAAIRGGIAQVERIATALNQILDLELAIMLETYREDLEAKHRNTERLATIGQFAASIGHELRNPLGVVESSLYLLRQHLRAEAEAPSVKKHLDRIGAEVQRANKTIHDLLDLARNRSPQRRATPLRELVDSAAEVSLLPAAVTLHVSVPSDLTLNIDPDQVRQVLTNLFINAAQALKGRGQIWVEVDPIGDGGARLRIRDDGPGIPAEDRVRVFEALYTTKAKGSGLGLALCRRIMEAHGGGIEIEARNDGASFLLVFPAPAPAPASGGEPT